MPRGRSLPTHVLPQCHALLHALLLLNRAPELSRSFSLSRSRSGRTRAELPWPPPPSSRATAAPSLTALLRLHRASLRIRRITTPLLRPFFGHRGRRSTVAASSGELKPPASVAVPPQAASGQAGQPSVCARTPWCFPITPPPTTYLLRPQQQAPAILCSVFPTRDVAQEFE